MLVESLPFLKCLDISGTNLAGTGKNSLFVISMVILKLLLFFDRRCWKNTKWQFSHRHSRIAKPDFQSVGYVGTLRHIPRSLSSSSHPCPLCHWRRQWRANPSSWKGIKFNSIRSRGKKSCDLPFFSQQAYIDRAEMMQGVLNDLYGIIRPETCQNPLAALDIILQAMENHWTESHIQISGR